MSLDLNDIQVDALKEIANIGAGHAAMALSDLTNRNVWISVPNVYFIDLNNIYQYIKDVEKLMMGSYIKLEGKISGTLMLFFTENSALKLLEEVTGTRKVSIQNLTGMNLSALSEIFNIIICNYLNAIADFFYVKIIPSPVVIAYDMLGALLDLILVDIEKNAGKGILFENNFSEGMNRFEGYVLFLPTLSSLEFILKKTGLAMQNGL